MVDCVAAASKSDVPPSEKLDISTKDEEKAAADVPQHEPGIIEVGNCMILRVVVCLAWWSDAYFLQLLRGRP